MEPSFATPALAPREPVTSLRFFGRAGAPLVLPPVKLVFTIGAGGCDLVIGAASSPSSRSSSAARAAPPSPPSPASTLVEPLHATLERVGSGLRVRDLATAHGVFPALRGPRVEELHVEAGDVFWIADVPLLALDARLDALRACIAWCVGLDRHIAIDEAVEAIAQGGPLLLLGPRGTDAAWLASAIHEAGPQRAGRLVSVADGRLPPLDALAGGAAMVFVDLDAIDKLPAPYAARLFEPARGLRVLFAAAQERRARLRLDTYRDRTRVVTLRPLAQRRAEIVRLLAIHWRDELRTGRHVHELPRIDELARYDWPRGFDELRDHSARLLAYLEHGGLRPAARALGIAHQSLAGHFQRIGFPIPDRSDRETFMPPPACAAGRA